LVNLGRQTWGHHHLCCLWVNCRNTLSLSLSLSLSQERKRERGWGGERWDG
jgi:hypothetical protein